MLKNIINNTKQIVASDLSSKLGFTTDQIDRGLDIAGTVTRDELKRSIAANPAVTRSLIVTGAQTPDAKAAWDRIGATYVASLTKELGMPAPKAALMKEAVVPHLAAKFAELAEGSEEKAKTFLN